MMVIKKQSRFNSDREWKKTRGGEEKGSCVGRDKEDESMQVSIRCVGGGIAAGPQPRGETRAKRKESELPGRQNPWL